MRRRSGLIIMARLFSLVGSLAFVLLLAILNGGLGHILAIFIPILGTIGIAKMLGATVTLSYQVIFILIISFGIGRGLLKYLEQYFNHFIAFKLLAVLRDKIYVKLCLLCPAKLEDKKKGSIISMLTADIETIEVFYAHTMSPLGIALLCSASICVFIGYFTNIFLALYALIAYVIVGVILPLISSRSISKLGSDYRESFTSFNGYFMDAIKGSKDIILHKKQADYKNSIDNKSNDLIVKSKKLKQRSTNFESLTQLIIVGLNLGMIALGIYLSTIGLADILWVIVAVVALMSSYGPVLALNALPANLSQTFASGDRLLDLLDEEPAVYDIENKYNLTFNQVKIQNLNFAYNEKTKVLKSINLSGKTGEIVGIMGKSGCGKSTLLKLMLRFWDKNSGNILYNNIDICDINTKCLKENVTMVSQSTFIFSDTVKNNMLIANKNASDDDIIKACKDASIHNHIMTLPKGYDTVIGAKGISLSAGETQRIGLARAFLSNAKIILLDEPTSNVDAINEGIILESLAKNKNDRLIIIVSHRESTMSIADKVYHFKDGECSVKE